ncbi:hypothetical protein FHX74_001251 [Friedmanniella endophytica]|uniref:Uncharacterized protein n=1 Tax=Microlunatus kandeliicorticis TaxID=1759536 RepID=A0A7W3IQZ5_9ACTN|nr:hypothetical protein [Microlunatus kandeliicorticis]MBA8793646.1 hypothetical protein [Microlunatus kandeliicorticis]
MASPIKVEGVQLPGDNMDPDAIETAATNLKNTGHAVSTRGATVLTTWQGLSASYEAPEQELLFTSMNPAKTKAESFGTDMGTAASALNTFASEVRTIKAEVAKIKADAIAFLGTIKDGKVTVHHPAVYGGKASIPAHDSDEDWDSDQDTVDKNNALIHRLNDQQEKLWTAERTCANALNAICGAAAIGAADPNDPNSKGYGYTDLPDNAEMPWGHSVERKEGCAESVVKGFFVDGLWNGMVQGLTSLVGFSWSGPDGIGFSWSTFGHAWEGVAKLGTALSPTNYLMMMMPGPAGDWARSSNKALVQTVTGMVGIDPYAKDPFAAWKGNAWRTGGSTVFNIASFLVPESKVGTVGKVGEAGDAAKLAETAGKTSRVLSFAGDAAKMIKGVTLDGLSKITSKFGDLGNLFKFGDDAKIPEVGRGDTGVNTTNVGGHGHADAPPARTPVDDGATAHPTTGHGDSTPTTVGHGDGNATHPTTGHGDGTSPTVGHGDPTNAHPVPGHGDGAGPHPTTGHGEGTNSAPVPAEHTPVNDPSLSKSAPEVRTQVDQIKHDIQPELQKQADNALQHALARAKAEGVSPTAQRTGTYAHTYLDRWIGAHADELVNPDAGYRVRAETSFDSTGAEVAQGTKGSIRPDIVIERQTGTGWEVVDVMDLKTGKAGISTTWANKVHNWLDPLNPPSELRPNPIPPAPVAGR